MCNCLWRWHHWYRIYKYVLFLVRGSSRNKVNNQQYNCLSTVTKTVWKSTDILLFHDQNIYLPIYVPVCVCVCVCHLLWMEFRKKNENLGTIRYSLPKLRRLAVSGEKANSQVGISLRDFRFSQRYCWRLKSSGMLRGVDWSIVTDVSREYFAATFRARQSHKTWMWYFGVYGVVGIVSRLQTGHPRNCGSIPGRGKGFFSSVDCPDRLWSPPSLLFDGYRVSYRGIKWPRHGGDHPPPI